MDGAPEFDQVRAATAVSRLAVESECQFVQIAADFTAQPTGGGGDEAMRLQRTGVAKRAHDAAGIAQDHGAFDAEIDREAIRAQRNLRGTAGELPGAGEQCSPFRREQGAVVEHRIRRRRQRRRTGAVSIADAGAGRRALAAAATTATATGELSGEYRAQIGHATAPGRRAIDRCFGLKCKALPQNFEHADQPECDTIGIELRLPRIDDQALDQQPHQGGKPFVLLPANVVVFLA